MQSKQVNLFHEHVLIKEPGATKEKNTMASRPTLLLRRRQR